MSALTKLKEGPNFVVYRIGDDDAGQKLIRISGIRFSYPRFGEPRDEVDEDTGRRKRAWQGVAMLPKATHVAAKEAFVEIMNELLKANKATVEPQYKCIKNGNDKEDENMHGHWLINFSESIPEGKNRQRPPARNQRNEVIDTAEKIDETFLGGYWGEVLLRPWFFDGKAKSSKKTFPKRVCCGYNGVKFTKTDTTFGQGNIDDSDVWGEAETGGGSARGFDDEDDGGL